MEYYTARRKLDTATHNDWVNLTVNMLSGRREGRAHTMSKR